MLSKALTIAAMTGVAAALGVTPARAAFLDFTVEEGAVPGSIANTFVADKINGGYVEQIGFSGTDFATSAYANFGQFFANEGTTLITGLQLNGLPAFGGYGLYALFEATGTVNGGLLVGNTASIELWLDPDQNTLLTPAVFGTPGTAVTPGGTTSDDLRLFHTDIFLSGTGVPGTPGAFNIFFGQPTFDATGLLYFPGLANFQLIEQVNGDFDDFQFTGIQTVSGDVSAVFYDASVPEPATLGLLGLGLLGAAFVRRRQMA
jgi:hypothetical protein